MMSSSIRKPGLQADRKLGEGNAAPADLATVTRPSKAKDQKSARTSKTKDQKSVHNRNNRASDTSGGKSASSSTSIFDAASRRSNGSKQYSSNGKLNQQGYADNMIEWGLTEYRSTEQYRAICAKKITSLLALKRANALLARIQNGVDPAAYHVCLECDRATDYELCPCVISVAPQQQAPPLPIDLHADIGHLGYVVEPQGFIKRAAYYLFDWEKPEYHLPLQNNKKLEGFSNSLISDQKLIPDLYNYIVNNLNVSYAVNGVEKRNLRLEHAKRLASKYVDTNNIDVTNDTVMSVRMRFTIQRATDQVENDMLYHETKPGRSFGQAWFPQSLMAWWRFTMLLCLIVLVFGTIIAWLSPTTIAARLLFAIAVRVVKTILWQVTSQFMPIGNMRLLEYLTGTQMAIFVLASVLFYQRWTQRGNFSRHR